MSALLRLLKSLWDFMLHTVADVLDWLRKPGSMLKVVCGVLAFGLLVSGLIAFEKEQRIKALGQQIVTIRTECTTRQQQLQRDVDDRDARLAQVAETLRAEAQKLEVLKAESAKALAGLADRIDAAEKDAASWRERYQQRPDSCKAALELLDSACPALGGY